jgi:hypothetical protein
LERVHRALDDKNWKTELASGAWVQANAFVQFLENQGWIFAQKVSEDFRLVIVEINVCVL